MSTVEEGVEDELSYIEFRQLTQDFSLRIPEEDVVKLHGLPGPSLLACSNRHGLLFFSLSFGFGWAKLSSLADGSNKLDYGKFELEDGVTSVLKVGGKDERWLLTGNGVSLYIFDLDTFAADPVAYEPKKIKTQSSVSQVIFGTRVLALAGVKVIEVDCGNGCVFDTDLEAKLLSCDEKTGKIMIVSESDEIAIIGASIAAEKRFKKPGELDALEIKSFFCLDERNVVVALEPRDKAKPFLDLYHVDLSGSDPAWIQFFDPTRPRKKSPSALMMVKLAAWDTDLQELVFIGNAASADIGTMGRLGPSNPMCSFFLSTEEFLPQLPVSVRSSRDDQYPVGMVLDFTNPELTPSSPERPPFPPSPILWILTNEGFLCPYRVIKNNSRTMYHGMALKSAMEFPNVLKKRVKSVKTVAQITDKKEPRDDDDHQATPQVGTLDISDVASGFTTADYGKYTNALISEFMAIRDMVQTDICQIRGALAQSADLVNGVRRKTVKSIKHLERDSLKLAQGCDNPAFLDLFKMEAGLHRMACDTKNYQVNSNFLRVYTFKLAAHSKVLQQYRESLVRTVDSLDTKVRVLVASRSNTEEDGVTVQQLGERAEKLKDQVVDLEQSLSLLKLSNTRGKTSVPPVAKPTRSQLAKFATKLTKRDPKHCLNTFTSEALRPIPTRKEEVRATVDPRFYSCVFPAYDEEELVSEPEELSPPPMLVGSSVEDVSHFDEFDYEEPDVQNGAIDIPKVQYEVESQSEDEIGAEPDPDTEVEDEIGTKVEAEEKSFTTVQPTEQDFNVLADFETAFDAADVEDKVEQEVVGELEGEGINDDTRLHEQVSEPASVKAPTVVPEDPLANGPPESSAKQVVNAAEDFLTEETEETPADHRVGVSEKKIEQKSEDSELVTIIETTDELDELLSPAYEFGVDESKKPMQVSGETRDEVSAQPENPSEPVFVVLESVPEPLEHSRQSEHAAQASSNVVPTAQVNEDFSAMDMSLDSFDQPAAPSSQPFSLGSVVISEPARPKDLATANSLFGVPSTLVAASAPVPPTQDQQSGGFFKAPVLGGFAPRPEESIFGKSTTFGQSTSGFGQSSLFGQASTFGQSSSFGQQSAPAQFDQASFGQPSFGQSSTFGQSSFGQPSFGSPSAPAFGASSFGQPSFGSPSAPTNQPSKVFGQSSTMASGVSGFGSLAPTAPATNPFGQPSQPDQQLQQQKKNLPSSFTQFRS